MLTEELRASARRVWDAILGHPFVVELYRGDLPLGRFRYYALQDYHFLVWYTKALALAAYKARDLESMRAMLELAYGTATGEMANYGRLLGRMGLTLRDAMDVEPNAANLAYTNFLAHTCTYGTFEECVAALLPCLWSYAEIAEAHRHLLERNGVDLYREWASTYLGEEYRRLVARMRGLLDASGAPPERLVGPFLTASRYEYMFWEAAYREERWPV